jgi:ribosomal protein S18 acetylase RimI-like enzyme
MKIRQFKSGDEEVVCKLHNEAFIERIKTLGESYNFHHATVEEIRDWLETEKDAIWLADVESSPVGYVHTRVNMEKGKKKIPTLYIVPTDWSLGESRIAVASSSQRMGVASELLQTVLDECLRQGLRYAAALSHSDNMPAKKLFESFGFSQPEVFMDPEYSEDQPLFNSSVYATLDLTKQLPDIELNSNVSVRKAKPDDINPIAEIHKRNVWWCEECSTLDWTTDYINGTFSHDVLVAELNGDVVGVADSTLGSQRIGIGGVLPENRGKGIGTTLLYGLLKRMKAYGIPTALADSGMTQAEAIRIYRRLGFNLEKRQYVWVKSLE